MSTSARVPPFDGWTTKWTLARTDSLTRAVYSTEWPPSRSRRIEAKRSRTAVL